MSTKSVDSAIRELTKTVSDLKSKVIALESVVLDQNNLIKKLINDNAGGCELAKSDFLNPNEGKGKNVPTQRPIRDARNRALSAISAGNKKTESARNLSPSLSVARVVKVAGNESPSPSAPTTPTPSAQATQPEPGEFVNNNNDASSQASLDVGGKPDWTLVQRRSRRRSPQNVTRGTATASSAGCALSAAERKSYLHLYYVQPGTTDVQVLTHLRNICPGDNYCSVEVLKPRGDYSSFKLSVSTKYLDKYMAPEHWPEGVHVKPWRSGFRKPQQ